MADKDRPDPCGDGTGRGFEQLAEGGCRSEDENTPTAPAQDEMKAAPRARQSAYNRDYYARNRERVAAQRRASRANRKAKAAGKVGKRKAETEAPDHGLPWRGEVFHNGRIRQERAPRPGPSYRPRGARLSPEFKRAAKRYGFGGWRAALCEILPYGWWVCEDGRQVLFNRDYQPIWERDPNDGVVRRRDGPQGWGADWGDGIIDERWFYFDRTPPWRDEESLARCITILRLWNIV